MGIDFECLDSIKNKPYLRGFRARPEKQTIRNDVVNEIYVCYHANTCFV